MPHINNTTEHGKGGADSLLSPPLAGRIFWNNLSKKISQMLEALTEFFLPSYQELNGTSLCISPPLLSLFLHPLYSFIYASLKMLWKK